MKSKIFSAKLFSIEELEDKINVFFNLDQSKSIVTFNQFTKIEDKISYVFIFNKNEPEVPLLITYCLHFDIEIYILNLADVEVIKSQINYARLLCVSTNDEKFCKRISKIIPGIIKKRTEINLSQFEKLNVTDMN